MQDNKTELFNAAVKIAAGLCANPRYADGGCVNIPVVANTAVSLAVAVAHDMMIGDDLKEFGRALETMIDHSKGFDDRDLR